MKKTIAGILTCFLCNCGASTTIYKEGRKIAKIQGDVCNLSLTISDESVMLSASTIDHSTPTYAMGEASNKRISAAAALAATGITIISK